MDELTHRLAGFRRRIRLARAADAALRWAFYASVGGCLALAASKFAGVALPYAPLAGALAVAPLAIYITVQGLRNALPQHVRVARWTLPIWLYVSVTGVVVYWMLYRVEW